MKTYYILLLLLTACFISNAQNIEGTILSKETNDPINGVHVFIEINKHGALTDSEGHFLFKRQPKINRNDTLSFSFIGYKSLRIPISEIEKNDGVIFLDKDLEKLNVVNIYSERKLNSRIRFTKLAPMKTGIHSFGSVLLEDKIYVMGGDASYLVNASVRVLNDYPDISFDEMIEKMGNIYSVEKYRKEFLIYDIQQNTWEISELKFQKRAYHNLIYYDGLYYILGGKNLQGPNRKEYLSDKIEVYDKDNNTIAIDDTNPHQAVDFSSVIYNDNLIVLGGSIRQNTHGDKKYSKKIHLYNFESGLWYELEDMPKAKETRSILINNKLYLIGGFNQIPLKGMETLDLENGEWQKEGDLFRGISKPAIAHDNDIIYFFENGTIYTYDTNSKELKEYLVDLFLQASAMYLSNHKLYIIGGYKDDNFTTRSSRDLFSIDLNEFENTRINRSKTL